MLGINTSVSHHFCDLEFKGSWREVSCGCTASVVQGVNRDTSEIMENPWAILKYWEKPDWTKKKKKQKNTSFALSRAFTLPSNLFYVHYDVSAL